jgi:S-adenosylmethionine decarboxylase
MSVPLLVTSSPPIAYSPGLHVLATWQAPTAALTDLAGCRAQVATLIAALDLTEVGAAWHAFAPAPPAPGGFTGAVALTESHLSIHTWPEFGQATLDVFLSNYRRDNADRARALYAGLRAYFGAEELAYNELRR